jgi:replicative DNA helicase
MSVLGAMLLDADAIGSVSSILDAEDFHSDPHRLIFETVLQLEATHVGVDLVTICEALERSKRLGECGGKSYLVELLDVLPSASNAEHYARIVREKSVRRRLMRAGEDIRREALTSDDGAMEILDRAETQVFEIGERESATGTVSIGKILEKTFDRLERLQETRGALTGLDTGYFRLNDMTGGLQRGDLVVLAARPSMGKTTFALNIALNSCLDTSARVLFISLEMSEEQIAQNLLCARAEVDANRVRKGQLTDRDWSKLQDAAGRLHTSPFLIDATPALTPMAIRTKARRVKKRLGGLDLVVVDYLQMVAAPPRAENRQQEISVISRNLKELARELNCPVVALSQLNRSVDSREDHRPRLSDLRESGAIEQDADLICFLYRDDYYRGEGVKPGEGSVTEVIIAKQRNGPTGKVDLMFFPDRLRFTNAAAEARP